LKIILTIAIAIAGAVALGPASASAEETKGYEVLCLAQTLPGGQPLPEICVPIVVPLPA
jgi:hypothetical protein